MQQPIKIALLATGDELTQGSVLNTNAQIIAQELFVHGFEPGWQMTVADDVEAIKSALHFLLQQHSVVITIGGLGPTSDDKTRFALASFLNKPLVEHSESRRKLEQRYQKINIPLTELSRQQAFFPENAEILENTVGSANGCFCRVNENKIIAMLPGPPRECLPMFREIMLPKLIPLITNKKVLLQWKVFGIAEGVIAEKVDTVLQPYASICRTSFRWDYPYVDCKVLLDEHAPEKEEILTLLNPILSPYQFDAENKRATEQLQKLLIQLKEPIFIYDEATGGLLESLIHIPANHKNVVFTSLEKINKDNIFFQIEGLKNYWNEKDSTNSELILTSNSRTETFNIPFRKNWLEIYATEFIAHQILKHLLS